MKQTRSKGVIGQHGILGVRYGDSTRGRGHRYGVAPEAHHVEVFKTACIKRAAKAVAHNQLTDGFQSEPTNRALRVGRYMTRPKIAGIDKVQERRRHAHIHRDDLRNLLQIRFFGIE